MTWMIGFNITIPVVTALIFSIFLKNNYQNAILRVYEQFIDVIQL
jgi:hypothetical protein